MSNIKFSQLPDLSANAFVPSGAIIPVVQGNINYTITGANLTTALSTPSKIQNGTSWANIATANGNVVINANSSNWVFTTSSQLLAGGLISTTGNITGNYILGNGSALTGLPATYSDANVTTLLGSLGSNIISSTGNITTTANIAGNYFKGNGSALTGITATPGGNTTEIQYNNAGALAANAAMTFDNTVGNVTLANLIIGTSTGNVVLGGNATRINTSNAYTGALATATGFQSGQIVIGNGYFGNLSLNSASATAARGAKFSIWDSANVVDGSNVGIRYSAGYFIGQTIIGNLTNNNTIMRGAASALAIGGGASGNTWSSTTQGISAAAGLAGAVIVGQPNATVALGNVTLNGVSGVASQTVVYAGSNIGNSAGILGQLNNSGNIQNGLGLVAQFLGTAAVTPANLIGMYMPGATNSYGVFNSNTMRAATNYYFLKNDDDVAQNQLGSLRAYHTFQAGGNTTGTWDINKNNGQVQAISTTGNVTIGSYTNFVTTANDGTNNDNQTDTVTLIIEQGSTPYTVTMPTGNSAIKYANGVSTVTATANTTTMIAITAYRTSANAAGYLTTISPAFS
jgi:hypothetical protein